MTSRTRQVTVDDGTVLYARHWVNEDPAGTVLIVHGVAEHSGRWEHVGEFLVSAGFDVHSYDMRGHGRSGGRPMYVESFDQYLNDLETMLAGVRIPERPVAVYGHSLGGLIAASYGVSHRPQPDLYVLSAPALGSTTPRVLRAFALAFGGLIPKLTAPTAISKDQLSRDPSVGIAYMADPYVHSRGTLRLGREVFRTMAATNRRLADLTTPTLVIHGAADRLVPPAASAPLAALPVVERKVFAGLAHEMHNEPEADVVLRFVADWLKAHLPRSAA